MATLFEVMLSLARRTRTMYYGSATGGTTTTLIDTVNRGEEDDAWNGQTLFVLSGDNANATRQITDFVESTSTLTVGTALSNAMAAGDRYGICNAIREEMVQAINAALEEIGMITQVDDTSLTVVDNQTEYTLPSGVANVVRVEVATSGDADYDYHKLFSWREINGKLYFDDELGFTAGRKIRIFYNGEHDAVSADADTIDEAIPMPLVGAAAGYWLALQKHMTFGNSNEKTSDALTLAQNERDRAFMRYKVTRLPRDPIHSNL